MKKSVTLIVVPFNIEKPQSKMIVQVDNAHANGGYLAEVVEVTPQGMFTKITDGKDIWNIMSSRIEAIKMYLLSDDEVKDGDLVFIEKYGIWDYKKAPCPIPYWGNKNNCKKIITGPEQIGIIAEYQSIAGANSKREITYKDIQNILDNKGKCSIEWEENQCDGCKANMPINEHGHHKDHQTFGIGCTKYLYDKPKLIEGKVIGHYGDFVMKERVSLLLPLLVFGLHGF